MCINSQPAFSLMTQAQRKSLAKRKRHKGISPPEGGDEGYAPATENFHQTDESHFFGLQSHLCVAPKRDAQVLSFP
ncbi:MAG: hypothetical protein PUA74_05755 [Clostridiales bacterium]|nr:hypothetical protein [Clostridiales bacterium]